VGLNFQELVEDALNAPIEGWDFAWLDDRATEERPLWHFPELVASRYSRAQRVLDLQTGGGELLAKLPSIPPLLVATEGYPPNITTAARLLLPRGATVIAVGDEDPLPFRSSAFDLVTSRHPTSTPWDEVARVLCTGGSYLSQQIGPQTVRELSEWMMGPSPPGSMRDPALARRNAEAAGLTVNDLREARIRTEFFDIGAVVYYLRLVVWIVPDFTMAKYGERLRALDQRIRNDGPFVTYGTRFLIEATKL
jgi:SAM-dependent methyltransferase